MEGASLSCGMFYDIWFRDDTPEKFHFRFFYFFVNYKIKRILSLKSDLIRFLQFIWFLDKAGIWNKIFAKWSNIFKEKWSEFDKTICHRLFWLIRRYWSIMYQCTFEVILHHMAYFHLSLSYTYYSNVA